MTLKYKVNGAMVRRQEFLRAVAEPDIVAAWEAVITRHAAKFEEQNANVILQQDAEKFNIISDFSLLKMLQAELSNAAYLVRNSKETITQILRGAIA